MTDRLPLPLLPCATDVAPLPINWLCPGYLPGGMVVVLDGHPGAGKSTVTMDIAARLSRGQRPFDQGALPRPVSTIVVNIEDPPHQVLVPRLQRCGPVADVRHCRPGTLGELCQRRKRVASPGSQGGRSPPPTQPRQCPCPAPSPTTCVCTEVKILPPHAA